MPTPVIPPPPTPPSAYRIMKNYAVKARQAGFVSEDAVALRIHFHIHCQKKIEREQKKTENVPATLFRVLIICCRLTIRTIGDFLS